AEAKQKGEEERRQADAKEPASAAQLKCRNCSTEYAIGVNAAFMEWEKVLQLGAADPLANVRVLAPLNTNACELAVFSNEFGGDGNHAKQQRDICLIIKQQLRSGHSLTWRCFKCGGASRNNLFPTSFHF